MLIIGDVDPSFFTAEQQKWISEFVEEGGGLVMIAGRKHNPASYRDNLIGKLLPVEFESKAFPIDDAKRPPEFSLKPKLSDIGRIETLMSLGDTPEENQAIWANLARLVLVLPRHETQAWARGRAARTSPTETIDDSSPLAKDKKQPMPLMARQYYGRRPGLVQRHRRDLAPASPTKPTSFSLASGGKSSTRSGCRTSSAASRN